MPLHYCIVTAVEAHPILMLKHFFNVVIHQKNMKVYAPTFYTICLAFLFKPRICCFFVLFLYIMSKTITERKTCSEISHIYIFP